MRRVLLLMALLAVPALADEARGKVSAVDEASEQVLLDSGRLLLVEPGTEIFRDGAPAKFDSVLEGDEVRASFDGLGNLRRLELVTEGGPEATPSGE